MLQFSDTLPKTTEKKNMWLIFLVCLNPSRDSLKNAKDDLHLLTLALGKRRSAVDLSQLEHWQERPGDF